MSAFWMDLHDVTVGQYKRFCAATGQAMPKDPGPDWGWQESHPMVNVTWDDARAYCDWVGGRLPTEAEWEKAARGGSEGLAYIWGDAWAPLPGSGNYADESAKRGRGKEWTTITGYDDGFDCTSPPGSFAPNSYGLFDMAGNVYQWCADYYDAGWYGTMPSRDPVNTTKHNSSMVRAGSFAIDVAGLLRVACRNWREDAIGDLGYRAVGPVGGVQAP